MKVSIKRNRGKRIYAASNGDWFKCQACGYTVRKLVLGNIATCSECGGRMIRI